MLTNDGLASLRQAATLALTLPTVQVRVASPTRVLVEVGWHFEEPLGDGVRLRPCSFRMAVGRAWTQTREGLTVDFCGLGDHEPLIAVTVGAGERVLPGDICRLPHLAAHLTAIRGRLLAEELIADPLVVRSR